MQISIIHLHIISFYTNLKMHLIFLHISYLFTSSNMMKGDKHFKIEMRSH